MKRSPLAAFTLLELSVVLVIIALVTAMAAISGISLVATARQNATVSKMSAIDKAMASYAAAYNRIPCPADLTITSGSNYGVEAANQWACTSGTPAANFTRLNSSGSAVAVAEGAVPAVTLGIPTDLMYDGWGNQFRYAVDVSMTQTGMFQMTPVGAKCGSITIQDATGANRSGDGTTSSVNPVPDGAIYALISHGPNGNCAYSRNGTIVFSSSINSGELLNGHCNTPGSGTTYYPTYVQMDPYTDTNTSDTNYQLNTFDDIVTYKERWQLQTPWDRAGVVCPYLYMAGNNFSHTAPGVVIRFDMAGHVMGSAVNATSTNGALSSRPTQATPDSNGNIWVMDVTDNRLQEYNSSGTWLMTVGGFNSCSACMCTASVCPMCAGSAPYTCSQVSGGSSQGQISAYTFTFDTSGNPWIAETCDRVDKFSPNGAYLSSLGTMNCTSGKANYQFNNPQSPFFDTNGNMWVADTSNHRISEFSSSGVWLNALGAGYNGIPGAIGSSGLANGQLYFPLLAGIDPNNNIWVVDSGNSRVQEFNNNGSLIQIIGPTIANGGCGVMCSNYLFNDPLGGAIDAMGNLWVLDASYGLMEFSSSGLYLGSHTSGGPIGTYYGGGQSLSFSEPNLSSHGGLTR